MAATASPPPHHPDAVPGVVDGQMGISDVAAAAGADEAKHSDSAAARARHAAYARSLIGRNSSASLAYEDEAHEVHVAVAEDLEPSLASWPKQFTGEGERGDGDGERRRDHHRHQQSEFGSTDTAHTRTLSGLPTIPSQHSMGGGAGSGAGRGVGEGSRMQPQRQASLNIAYSSRWLFDPDLSPTRRVAPPAASVAVSPSSTSLCGAATRSAGNSSRSPAASDSMSAHDSFASRMRSTVQEVQRFNPLHIEHNRLSTSLISFHLSQFLEQICYQMLLPFSLPLVLLIRGKQAARNMQMMPNQSRAYIQSGESLFLFALLLAHATDQDLGSVGDMQLVAMLFLFCACFRTTIAIKYAYMPPRRYERWMREVITPEEQGRETLATWLSGEHSMLRHEIQVAAARLGVCMHSNRFIIEPEVAEELRARGDDVVVEQRAGHFELEAIDVCQRLLVRAAKTTPYKVMTALSAGAALLNCGLLGQRLFSAHWHGSALNAGFLALSMLFLFYWSFILCLFIVSAYAHYRRRRVSLHLLHQAVAKSLIMPADYHKNPSVWSIKETNPMFSLMYPTNVRCFLILRRVILNIGLRYQQRQQAFTSIALTIIFAISVAFIVSIMTHNLESWMSVEPNMLLMIFFIGALLLASIVQAAGANDSAKKDMALLHSRSADSQAARRDAKRSHASSDVLDSLDEAHELITHTIQAIENDDHLYPVVILGVRASRNILRSIVVISLSIASLLARLLLG